MVLRTRNSRPLVLVYVAERESDWHFVGCTEFASNSNNPIFKTPVFFQPRAFKGPANNMDQIYRVKVCVYRTKLRDLARVIINHNIVGSGIALPRSTTFVGSAEFIINSFESNFTGAFRCLSLENKMNVCNDRRLKNSRLVVDCTLWEPGVHEDLESGRQLPRWARALAKNTHTLSSTELPKKHERVISKDFWVQSLSGECFYYQAGESITRSSSSTETEFSDCDHIYYHGVGGDNNWEMLHQSL